MNKKLWQVNLEITERSHHGKCYMVVGFASDAVEAGQLAVKKLKENEPTIQGASATSIKYVGELYF